MPEANEQSRVVEGTEGGDFQFKETTVLKGKASGNPVKKYELVSEQVEKDKELPKDKDLEGKDLDALNRMRELVRAARTLYNEMTAFGVALSTELNVAVRDYEKTKSMTERDKIGDKRKYIETLLNLVIRAVDLVMEALEKDNVQRAKRLQEFSKMIDKKENIFLEEDTGTILRALGLSPEEIKAVSSQLGLDIQGNVSDTREQGEKEFFFEFIAFLQMKRKYPELNLSREEFRTLYSSWEGALDLARAVALIARFRQSIKSDPKMAGLYEREIAAVKKTYEEDPSKESQRGSSILGENFLASLRRVVSKREEISSQ